MSSVDPPKTKKFLQIFSRDNRGARLQGPFVLLRRLGTAKYFSWRGSPCTNKGQVGEKKSFGVPRWLPGVRWALGCATVVRSRGHGGGLVLGQEKSRAVPARLFGFIFVEKESRKLSSCAGGLFKIFARGAQKNSWGWDDVVTKGGRGRRGNNGGILCSRIQGRKTL